MPIAKWKCPACHSIVDLDHYTTTRCGMAVHPDYAAAVLGEQEDNHPGGKVRVSAAGSCPRAAAILKTEEIAVDPLASNAMLTGTAWHQLMGHYGMRPALTNTASVEVEVTGTIDGIAIVGHIDRVLRWDSDLIIADWKHTNDFARKYLTAAKPEHIVQTSLYAELYDQTFGVRPTSGVNWYHFTTSPPLVPMWYDLWPVERALEHRPYQCDYTVSQLLHQAAKVAEGKVRWEDLPLVGESFQFGGKNACDYCSVFDVCKVQATGAPF